MIPVLCSTGDNTALDDEFGEDWSSFVKTVFVIVIVQVVSI